MNKKSFKLMQAISKKKEDTKNLFEIKIENLGYERMSCFTYLRMKKI